MSGQPSSSNIAAWLGFSTEQTEAGLRYHLAFDDKHIGNPAIRAIHGGVVATFLEAAAQASLAARLDTGATLKTINLDIDYLNSARAQDMTAKVSVTRLGRRIAFVEATGWQQNEGRPVAIARFRIRIGV